MICFILKCFTKLHVRQYNLKRQTSRCFAVSEYLGERCDTDVATGNGTALTSETCLRATDIY